VNFPAITGIVYKIRIGNFSSSTTLGVGAKGPFEIICGGPIQSPVPSPTVDVKPTAFPNLIRSGSNGVVPVAIVGTAELDVAQIDVATVRLSPLEDEAIQVAPYLGAGPSSGVTQIESSTALVVNFRTVDLAAPLKIDTAAPGTSVEVMITGQTLDGTEFRVVDSLKVNGTASEEVVVNVTSNVPNVWVNSDKMDLSYDTGGFGPFARHFQGGEGLVTYTAPQTANGKAFSRWVVDGVAQPTGVRAIAVDVSGNHNMEARYVTTGFTPPGGGTTLPGGTTTPKKKAGSPGSGPINPAGGN
jgi:hypothetical protein